MSSRPVVASAGKVGGPAGVVLPSHNPLPQWRSFKQNDPFAAGSGGVIVDVSSHQAQRPVRGALPYATAAAVEGLTLAFADLVADAERLGLYEADPVEVKAALKAAGRKTEG